MQLERSASPPSEPASLENLAEADAVRQPLVRRVVQQDPSAGGSASSRRRSGALLMALIAVAALLYRRKDYDSLWVMLVECAACISLIGLAQYLNRRSERRRWRSEASLQTVNAVARRDQGNGLALMNPISLVLVSVAVAMPWLVDFVARQLGFGNGAEIVMLSSLAWGSLAAAILGRRSRMISLSVVCSGFLTLFTTLISDAGSAILFAYAWGILCLCWLVANHWEQVEAYAAVRVQSSRSQRLIVVGMACLIFFIATAVVSDRTPVLRKLRAEIMPTSGGTSDKDTAARYGVGNGDTLIAARQHASSFGAVETDLFLDSEKPSLFDLFSDEFGEPKFNKKVELAQALDPNDVRSNEGEFSEANRSSSSDEFSSQRDAPRKRPETEDLASDALFFWQGEAGVRLAVQRFNRFDGLRWTHSVPMPKFERGKRYPEPPRVELDGRTWFRPSTRLVQNALSPFVDALPEAIKFTRYGSAIIPARSGMQLWSIDKITQADFFTVFNGCLVMPGRERVPDYTLLRFVNSRIDEERLTKLMRACAPGEPHTQLSPSCSSRISAVAHEYADGHQRGWSQVTSVIQGIRRRFRLEPDFELDTDENATPLEQFLKHQRGPSYLFATASALMLEHLGYSTRLVTGFYADPKRLQTRDGEIAITPRDAHVWLEINVGHGYWIPLEPTPGYRQPRLAASVWYRLYQARYSILWILLSSLAAAALLFVLRSRLFEWACRAAWPLLSRADDRRRIAWIAFILDQRLRLAGQPRPQGCVPRQHLLQRVFSLPDELRNSLQTFFLESDQLCFGGERQLSVEGRQAAQRVWKQLTVHAIRRGLNAED